MKKRLNAEVFVLLAVVIAAGYMIADTFNMSSGAALFPRFVAISLVLLCGYSVVMVVVAPRRVSAAGSDAIRAADAPRLSSRRAALSLVGFYMLALAFIASLPWLGFEVAAVVFLVVAMALLEPKSPFRYWWVALLVPTVLSLVFRWGMELRLPWPALLF